MQYLFMCVSDSHLRAETDARIDKPARPRSSCPLQTWKKSFSWVAPTEWARMHDKRLWTVLLAGFCCFSCPRPVSNLIWGTGTGPETSICRFASRPRPHNLSASFQGLASPSCDWTVTVQCYNTSTPQLGRLGEAKARQQGSSAKALKATVATTSSPSTWVRLGYVHRRKCKLSCAPLTNWKYKTFLTYPDSLPEQFLQRVLELSGGLAYLLMLVH